MSILVKFHLAYSLHLCERSGLIALKTDANLDLTSILHDDDGGHEQVSLSLLTIIYWCYQACVTKPNGIVSLNLIIRRKKQFQTQNELQNSFGVKVLNWIEDVLGAVIYSLMQ